MTVLLVDDFKAMLDVLQAIFEKQGYVVFAANDGEKAMTILSNHPIDTVIADYQMPGLSGVEVGKRIRQLKPDTKLILYTSCDPQEIPAEAYEIFDKVCEKSVSVTKLLEAVEAIPELTSRG